MNSVRVHPIIYEYSKSYVPFGTKMQSQNEFPFATLFARNLHWSCTRGVTLANSGGPSPGSG